MSRHLKTVIISLLAVTGLTLVYIGGYRIFGSHGKDKPETNDSGTEDTSPQKTGIKETVPKSPVQIDYAQIKPDESGRVMVVMFHNFVQSFVPKKYDKGEYTTTFEDFRSLLKTLYDKGYRSVSFKDYLDNNISVPAGCIPIVLTFDDGTSGQFNLVMQNGKLAANKDSAVGIMEEFHKSHPDFGLNGTFYINLGDNTFKGEGTVAERLKYLIDKGFEIGNHTYNHVNLKTDIKTVEQIELQIGENQKKMYELVPGYKMNTFSLPFGAPSKNLQGYVVKGSFEDVGYQHQAVVEVGWDPAPSPVSTKFNPLSTHRVRASGIKPVQADLAWWLDNLSRNTQYISDGDPGTVAVPKDKAGNVDAKKLNGKKLITY